ncbi:MAG: hypothetical protein ACTTKX_05570 [Treponema sp.]
MKKLSVIGSLIISLALVAMSLTSCVTHNSGEDYVFAAQKLWIVGTINDWKEETALELKKSANNIFEGEYKAVADGEIQFKVFVDKNKWGKDATYDGVLTLGTSYTFAAKPGAGNAKIVLQNGKKYKIKVDGTRSVALIVTISEIKS